MGWLPFELDPATRHEPVAERVRIQQALEVIKQLPITISGNLSLSTLTVFALWGAVSPTFMLSWLAVIWVMAIPTARRWLQYRQAPVPARVSVNLVWRAALFSLAVALPWATCNWFMFDASSRADEVFLVFVTAGLTAGVITTLATIPAVCMTYVLVISLPLIARLLLEGDPQHAVMAIMLILYISYLSMFVRSSYRRLIAEAEGAIERQLILKKLEDTHRRLSWALERASDEILLFDANESLVLSNGTPADSLLFPPERMQQGATLGDIIGSSVHAGLIPSAVGNAQIWIAEFLRWFRNPEQDLFIETSGNRRCALTVQPAADGETFLVLTDVTKLREQEAIAQQSSQRLKDFAEIAADWIWELDENAIFTVIAPYQPSPIPVMHLVGQPFLGLEALMPNKAAWNAMEAEIAAKRPFRDFRFRIKNGHQTWSLSASGKPVFDDNGQFKGHRGSFRDVTKEVLAASQLKEAKNNAEDASRAKSEFLAHMSHELRTPLNAILGFSEIMALGVFGKIDQPKYRDYVDNIHDSGAHLLAIINDILDISRIESGKGELSEEVVSVDALFESVLRLIEGRAIAAGHTINVMAPANMPGLWADARMLKQIMLNLLSNAVKFTPARGRITLCAELTEQAAIRMSVSDNGYGISDADQKRVLIPFDRGSANTRGDAQGSGLGLPLTKMLTELHGGELLLTSKIGKGTTVFIEFPAGRTRMETRPIIRAAV